MAGLVSQTNPRSRTGLRRVESHPPQLTRTRRERMVLAPARDSNHQYQKSGFKPFQRLPLEIQFMIFELAWPAGQRVRMSRVNIEAEHEVEAPVSLYVCKASREAALSKYRCIGLASSLTRKPQWFRSEGDTLYVHARFAFAEYQVRHIFFL